MKKRILPLLLCHLSFSGIAQEFEWGFGIGGSSSETIEAIESGGGGIYITGKFNSQNLDFDHSSELALVSPISGSDIFLARYDYSGDFVWVKTIQGSGFLSSYDLTIENNGKILVTGGFNGTVNFDSDGNHELTATAGSDAFVARFDSDGNFENVFGIHGVENTVGYAIETDGDGDIYLAGTLSDSADFDPSIDSVYITNDPGGLFVAKYSESGAYHWAWGVAGEGGTDVKDMAVGTNGDLVVTGLFQQTIDLDPGPGTNEFTSEGIDAYVLKANEDGIVQWGSVFTGSNNQISVGVDLDQNENIYVCGRFNSEIDLDPTAGEEIVASPTNASAFLTKLGLDGSYQWGRTISNQGDGTFVDVKSSGFFGVQVIGTFNGTITLPDDSTIFSTGGRDILSIKYSDSGAYEEHLIFGGSSHEDLNTGCTDMGSFGFLVGGNYFGTIDFAPGQDTLSGPVSAGNEDLFLVYYAEPLVESVFESHENVATIYPNPTSDFVRVSTNENWNQYRIHELTGKSVLTGSKHTDRVNVSVLPSGTYILQILIDGHPVSQGLMLKK